MRPVLAAVCQRLIVVSNCMPGSAHSQAAWAIWRIRSRARMVLTISPVVTARRCQSASSTTACMNSSVTRTELLAFWYWTEAMSRPSRPMSKPACSRTRTFCSSRALNQMNSSMSGWSTSRMTILAARRVLPPDLMVPAEASAPRMKLTGPEAVPPPLSSSTEERMRRQVDARARAALEDRALLDVPVEDRVHLVVDGEDEAGRGLLGHARDADVEPHRRVERRLLGDEQVLELVAEGLGLVVVDEVAALDAPAGDRVGHPVDHLPQRRLPLGRAEGAPEVLLGDDVRGVQRPGGRELDPELLEGDRAVTEVRDAGVAPLPVHLVVGVRSRRR